MPFLSVTLIGFIVGVAFLVVRPVSFLRAIGRGIAGAWVGFIGGALLGGIADVVLATGGALAVLGHGAAIAGAVAAEVRGG